MAPEKNPLPGEVENRDKTSFDIIKSCFGDQDGLEAAVFAKKSQIENSTGRKVKIDKDFTRLIFEEYPDKKLLEDRITTLTSNIRGILSEPEAKNFGMDEKESAESDNSQFKSEIHRKSSYYHEKRQGLKEDD